VLDTTADTWYTWIGLVAASVAVASVAVSLPSAPPPDPGPLVRTVEGVTASPYGETERVSVVADRIRLGPKRVSLRSDGGTAHGTFATAVVPVRSGPLRRVLAGRPPPAVFERPAAFEWSLRTAAERTPRWRAAPDHLAVRRVSWRGVSATLVG
jgi:hypothetical protein